MFSVAEKSGTSASPAPKSRDQQFFGKKPEPGFFDQPGFFTPVQAKLNISKPDDKYEREADHVADTVMRMPESPDSSRKIEGLNGNISEKDTEQEEPLQRLPTITGIQCKQEIPVPQPKFQSTIQRSEEQEESYAENDHTGTAEFVQARQIGLYPSDVVQRSGRGPPATSPSFEHTLSNTNGGGNALPSGTKDFMESRFQADFSGVRIHTGNEAEALSHSINAQAFTHGRDIYFNSGKFSPSSAEGRHLLAHELTHTIQQGASPGQTSKPVSRKIIQARPEDPAVPSQLNQAVDKAKSAEGQVNANQLGDDGFREGWTHFLDFFKTGMGPDKITGDRGGPAGTIAEADIKNRNRAMGMRPNQERPSTENREMRDAMPSWCGIFVWWALKKSGVPMPLWQLGGRSVDAAAAYGAGYTPKAGDIAYRNLNSHFAIVEKTTGSTVTTVNGNTAGEDNLGGQVQTRDHPLSDWTAFFDPLKMMQGALGSPEGEVETKPKSLAEMRRELFNVQRKEEGAAQDPLNETIPGAEKHGPCPAVKAEPVQNAVQPNAKAYTQKISNDAGSISAEPENIQRLEEGECEERGPPVQLKTTEHIQCGWLDDALSVVSSAIDYAAEGLEAGKRLILNEARDFVMAIPGYRALRVALGSDPITGERIERNGHNFIEAAFDIMPGGRLLHEKLTELGALTEAEQFVDRQIAGLESLVSGVISSVEEFWRGISLTDLADPVAIFRRAGNIIHAVISNVISFAETAARELLAIVKRFLLNQLVGFIRSHTTAYPLLTVILERDPVTDEAIERNGTNILNAILELGGEAGREQRRQMQDTGTFQRVAAWIDDGIMIFSGAYHEIRAGFDNIWSFARIESLMHPIDTFNRIYEIFAAPIRRVWDFVSSTARIILQMIKEVLLRRLSAWARGIRGYSLLTVIIGQDPFTHEEVPFTMENVIRGFMSLMPGGEEQYNQLRESGAIERTTSRIRGAIARLNLSVTAVIQLFIDLWNSFSINDLAHPVEAFRRIAARFGVPITRLINFIVEIVKIVVEVILGMMNFPVALINNIITRAMAAFDMIKRDPVGFLKNLLRSIKQGFIQFFNNILTHLLNGLTSWLMSELRDAGITAPQDFSLRGIITWVLGILGISMERIWQKLTERFGAERVARIRGMVDRLEGIWTFIRDVQERGIAAIWERIQEQLSTLWDTVLDTIKNWIMERIVNQVVARLLSMLDPTGIMAVINSAIALYRAIQSFIRYLRQMLEIVNSFVEGVAEIASGNIRIAANFLENTMARAVPIVIGFLANQVGLGGIGRRIAEIIGRVRALVDRALDWLLDRAIRLGGSLLQMGRNAAGAVVNAVRGWLGLRRDFTARDNSPHHLYWRGEGTAAQLIVETDPTPSDVILQQISLKVHEPANAAYQNDYNQATIKNTEINTLKARLANDANYTAAPQQKQVDYDSLNQKMLELAGHFGQLLPLVTAPAPPAAVLPAFNSGVIGGPFEALFISNATPRGQPASANNGATLKGWSDLQRFPDPDDPSRSIRERDNYVKMHYLHDQLGGLATDSNLGPVKSTYNTAFYNAVENFAVTDKNSKALWYSFVVEYFAASGPEPTVDYSGFPKTFTGKYGQMEYNGNAWAKKDNGIHLKTYSSPVMERPDLTGGEREYEMNSSGRTTLQNMRKGVLRMTPAFAIFMEAERNDAHDTGRHRKFRSYPDLRSRLLARNAIRASQSFDTGIEIVDHLGQNGKLKFS